MLQTGEKYSKIFVIPNSKTMRATEKVRLATAHWLRESAADMDMVPIVHSTLISACKLADADYGTVLD